MKFVVEIKKAKECKYNIYVNAHGKTFNSIYRKSKLATTARTAERRVI